MMLPNFTTPLFDLTHLDRYLSGYLMSADGSIYSTKSGRPVKLGGSRTPSGLYFTLNGRSFRQDRLQAQARIHPKFVTETNGLATPATTLRAPVAQGGLPVALPGRTKSAREAVVSKGYLLATLNPKGALVFGTEPVFHLTDTTAKQEAERIAGTTGAEVVMLKIVGKVKVQKAVWE